MSELKEIGIRWEENGKLHFSHVYHKFEADKFIAEKDKEIAQLQAMLEERNKEVGELKEMMPKYKQFIEDEDYRKKLVDEYAGYVYEWAGHRYIATPYINVFIKGILRTLYKALANWAWAEHVRYVDISDGSQGYKQAQERWEKMANKCFKKAREYK